MHLPDKSTFCMSSMILLAIYMVLRSYLSKKMDDWKNWFLQKPNGNVLFPGGTNQKMDTLSMGEEAETKSAKFLLWSMKESGQKFAFVDEPKDK
jgi:hypothetical protein